MQYCKSKQNPAKQVRLSCIYKYQGWQVCSSALNNQTNSGQIAGVWGLSQTLRPHTVTFGRWYLCIHGYVCIIYSVLLIILQRILPLCLGEVKFHQTLTIHQNIPPYSHNHPRLL